jgi:hypothetical protein
MPAVPVFLRPPLVRIRASDDIEVNGLPSPGPPKLEDGSAKDRGLSPFAGEEAREADPNEGRYGTRRA